MILHCFLLKKIAEKRLNFKYLYSVINIFHIRTQNLLPFFFLLLKKKGSNHQHVFLPSLQEKPGTM